jgi:hypothetical protein
MPRFRLITVLALTKVFAIALLALVRPSVVWLFLWPPLACLAVVFAAIRAITTSRERLFWIGLIVGVTAYGGSVLFIELISAVNGGPETASSVVVALVWELIHGTEPSLRGPARRGDMEFVSFTISLHVFVTVLFSLIATLLAQYFMRSQD